MPFFRKSQEGDRRSLFSLNFSKNPSWWPNNLLGNKGDLLGTGQFAEVYSATYLQTGQNVALKIMKAKPSDVVLQKSITREIDILTEVSSHPGIVGLLNHFRAEERVGLIFERCYGGELFDILEATSINNVGDRIYKDKKGGAKIELSEQSVATILGQILDVIQFIHGRGIVHRDMKLENIMFEKPFGSQEGGALKIKMIDFGLSKRVSEGNMTEPCGSAYYTAPEVMNAAKTGRPYSTPADMWSVGVIAFCLLCLEFPFDSDSTLGVINASARGQYSWPESIIISDDAKDFVGKCLQVAPEKRLTVQGALHHRWIRSLRLNNFAPPPPTGRSSVDIPRGGGRSSLDVQRGGGRSSVELPRRQVAASPATAPQAAPPVPCVGAPAAPGMPNGGGRSSAEVPQRGRGSLDIPRGGSGGRSSLELPQRRPGFSMF